MDQGAPILQSISEYLRQIYPNEVCISGAYLFGHPKEPSAFNPEIILRQAEYAATMMNEFPMKFAVITHSIGSVVAKLAI